MTYRVKEMDLKALTDRVLSTYRQVNGEQETKNKLIEPFFEMLGYDIDEIEDIRTEVTCDFGIKQEKVDYILCIAGNPKILVEAKDWRKPLNDVYVSQLYRYYCTSGCKLAILTNGLEYWFFADLEKENIMDDTPFYKLKILAPKPADRRILTAICKVQQCSYDVEHFVAEIKIQRLIRSDKIGQMISEIYLHDSRFSDSVYTALEKYFTRKLAKKEKRMGK